jgi:N-acetylglucosamine kinase-like BadF-type ATPase
VSAVPVSTVPVSTEAASTGAVPRAAVLAIDGGNSKTDVALIGTDGSILGVSRGGNSNHQGISIDGTVGVLSDLVRSAAAQAGLPATGLVAQHTSACLAGADLPSEEADLSRLVASLGWSETSEVLNDTFAVLRAGLDDGASPHWGIGVVCGAGINCVGVAPDGRTTRFLSLGELSGDWGGGGDLGPKALWWAVRAEDGRGPETELREAVPAHFGLERVEDLVISVHLGKIAHRELHGLVPVLFEVAGRGDRVARDVLMRQAEEIFLMAEVAARRLGLTDPDVRGGQPVPVVLGGSLMTARDPLLTGAIADRVTARIPDAAIRIVDVPPVAGAALLGLDHVGAPPSAAARLRDGARATW